MSMEIYVLSDEKLNSISEWQHAIDAVRLSVRLSTETQFAVQKGFLPARSGDTSTGFECDHWDATKLMAEYSAMNFGHQWKYALAFRWGADLRACVAAYAAGAAYAGATRAVVLDCEQGKIISAQQAAEVARDIEKRMAEIEAAIRRTTEQFRP